MELRIDHLKDYSVYQPGELVTEVHDAFRGELWIDDQLCCRDDIEVLRLFKRDFCDEW
jgi:hypothetical protein